MDAVIAVYLLYFGMKGMEKDKKRQDENAET